MARAIESQQTLPSEATPLLEEIDAGGRTVVDHEASDNTAQIVLSPARATFVGAAVAISMLIQATNMTMVTTSQSAIAADLDAYSNATWLTASFLIAVASVTPLGGRLCQIFSLRNLIATSNVIASAGLLLTASAKTLPVFLLGRALTGCGGAGIYSTQAILVLELASKRRRGLFLGAVASIFTVGLAGGAVLAGAVTPRYGWRLIYYVQSPLALLAAPVIYFGIPAKPRPEDENNDRTSKLARLDYLGIATLTAANVLFLYSVSSNVIPYSLLLVSAVLFAVFFFVESSPTLTTEPIIPPSLIRSRGVLLTCLSSLGLMMSRWSVVIYTPVYGIAVRGWSPAEAGMILIPTNFGFGLGGLVVGWIHIRKVTSYYTSCLVMFAIFIASFLLIALLSTTNSPVYLFFFAVFCNGFCAGALLNYTLSHVLHLTLPSTHFIVTSLVATFRSFAGSFGSAVGGGIFSRVLKSHLEAGFNGRHDSYSSLYTDSDKLIRELLGSPALVWKLEGYEREVAVAAYQSALRTTFFAAFCLVMVMAMLQAGTGWKAPVDSSSVQNQNSQSLPDGDITNRDL